MMGVARDGRNLRAAAMGARGHAAPAMRAAPLGRGARRAHPSPVSRRAAAPDRPPPLAARLGLARVVRVTRHAGDGAPVTRVQLASRTSRLFGYTVSVYLVDDADGGTWLVDTGLPRAWPVLAPLLGLAGAPTDASTHALVRAGALRGGLVTHAHEDHAGGAAALAAAGVPLAMGDETRARLVRPERIPLYRRATWGTRTPLPTDAPVAHAPPFALVATPGHSPDHHVVWDAAHDTVYAGDLYLGVKVRIAHPEESPRALVASLRTVAALRPRRLFDGHRGLVTDPGPLLAAKAAWLEETIGAIETLAARGWPAGRIRARVLGREPVTGWASRGEYSKGNLVRAVLDGR